MICLMLYNLFQKGNPTPSFTQFMDMLKKGQIKDVEIQGPKLFVTSRNDQTFTINVPADPDLIRSLKEKNVSVSVTAKKPSESNRLLSLFKGGSPFILLIGVWIFFMRKMKRRLGSS